MDGEYSRDGAMKTIQAMADRIAERFKPERVILFGSYANGSPGPDSDADFLVVLDSPGSKRDLAVKMGLEVTSFGFPKDIFVLTPDELKRYGGIPNSLASIALEEGVELYRREA